MKARVVALGFYPQSGHGERIKKRLSIVIYLKMP